MQGPLQRTNIDIIESGPDRTAELTRPDASKTTNKSNTLIVNDHWLVNAVLYRPRWPPDVRDANGDQPGIKIELLRFEYTTGLKSIGDNWANLITAVLALRLF